LPGPGLPAEHGRVARAKGGHHDGYGARLFHGDVGGACAPRVHAHPARADQPMKLLITGVSHKTAPVEVREILAFREESLAAALTDLKARDGVAEAVILSTCNRVEITVAAEDQSDPRAIVDSFLAD